MADRATGTKHRYRLGSGRLMAGLAAAGLLLVACGGGGSGTSVAALSEDDAADAASGSTDGAATEEELLEYTECLRDQGLDIEDPEIDEDGNVVFGGPRAGFDDADQDDLAQLREDLQAAQEVCGPPPGGGFGNRAGVDQTEIQDAFLELAQCMRDNGVDVPDPDFSDGGFGGDGGGPFGDIDPNDPALQEAFEECRDVLSDTFPGGGPGGPGGPGVVSEES